MQALIFILAAISAILALLVNAENCTTQVINDALQLMAPESTYTRCKSDSIDTLQTSKSPLLNQTRALCSSLACRAILNTTLALDRLPECQLDTGIHSLTFKDATSFLSSKCESFHGQVSLQERAVDEGEVHGATKSVSEHVGSALAHSAPMEEIDAVAGALLSLLRL